MKYIFAGILVLLVCTGGVLAVQEYICFGASGYCSSIGPSSSGNVYFSSDTNSLPDSPDITYSFDGTIQTTTATTMPYGIPKPAHRISLAVGTYFVTIERPGYQPFNARVNVCDCENTYVEVNLLPIPPTTTTTTPGSGYTIKPAVSGFAALKTTTAAVTTTSASSGSLAGKIQAPTIVPRGTGSGTTTAVPQGSGTQAGGAGSQNAGTGTTDSGQAGSVALGTADTAATGSLSVTTTPAGAAIYLDGVQRGVSPATIPGLTPGDHTLLLKLDGYTDLSTPVTITAGQIQSYDTALARTAKTPGFETVLGITAIGTVLCLRKRNS